MPNTSQQIIDGIALDLDTYAGLPDHSTIKYRRPRAILPADCPMLVCWLLGKSPRPLTTERFDSEISIGVSWHLETIVEAQTLERDTDKSIELIDALERIEDRVRLLAANGVDVDAAYQVLPGEVAYLPPEMQQGLTEGYALEVNVRVTED